jgi:hypothetical protein
MEKKFTTVEWFVKELYEGNEIFGVSDELFELAKEMEEDQRKKDVINAWNSAAGGDAFSNAEQYYISTFKSE